MYRCALALLILKSSLDDVSFLHIFALVLNLFLIIYYCLSCAEVAFYKAFICGLKLVFGSWCFKVPCELLFNLVLVILIFLSRATPF